ncbi:hypothetical protein COCNU_04G007210 [Cocos nucifera]|uniref:Uncharacterized protein n=1 Tax=Cocos nucifera TaxID=13894 RepID=A0A8K0I6L6_COCNU|nr:hypothetical protein COCNU_04G007200 [Cocos nucifera]KAG1338415.1 hypothetical protein COCNU_04G007210 [Cocos nucifera]
MGRWGGGWGLGGEDDARKREDGMRRRRWRGSEVVKRKRRWGRRQGGGRGSGGGDEATCDEEVGGQVDAKRQQGGKGGEVGRRRPRLEFARRKPKDGATQSGSGDKEKEARECERREGKHARSGIRSLEEPLRLE